MIDGKNFFRQPVKGKIGAYNNILKITTDQGYVYTTGCLLFHPNFNEHYNVIVIDLSKQQALNTDPKEIQ